MTGVGVAAFREKQPGELLSSRNERSSASALRDVKGGAGAFGGCTGLGERAAVGVRWFADHWSASFCVFLYPLPFSSSQHTSFSLSFGSGSEGGSQPLISIK